MAFITQTKAEEMKENLQMLREPEDDSEDEDGVVHGQAQKLTTVVSFQIKGEAVETSQAPSHRIRLSVHGRVRFSERRYQS